MKVSISLPHDDLEFLDKYAKQEGMDSRSAVILKAVRLLRASKLEAAYEAALKDWEESGEKQLWDQTSGDGL